LETPNKNH
jgi:serine/threonine protein phosphatase PrpC